MPTEWRRNFDRAKKTRKKKHLKAWLYDLKLEKKCCDCGFSHPAALHFHHIHGKEMDITKMVRNSLSKKRILAEIEKCVPLCANCHAIRHYNEDYAPIPTRETPVLIQGCFFPDLA